MFHRLRLRLEAHIIVNDTQQASQRPLAMITYASSLFGCCHFSDAPLVSVAPVCIYSISDSIESLAISFSIHTVKAFSRGCLTREVKIRV